jgi:hypothetical protein
MVWGIGNGAALVLATLRQSLRLGLPRSVESVILSTDGTRVRRFGDAASPLDQEEEKLALNGGIATIQGTVTIKGGAMASVFEDGHKILGSAASVDTLTAEHGP